MPDHEHLPEEYCVLESGDHEFHVGILGVGPGFESLLDIVDDEECRYFLPPMRLAALAEAGPDSGSRVQRARAMGATVHDTCPAMLAAHPEINLIIELSGKRHTLRQLRRDLPETVSLIDHAGAVFLCGVHALARAGAHCRVNLDRQQELLRAIIDEIREDIYLLDREGRVADLNRTVQERTGKKKEDLLGRPCWEVQTLGEQTPFCPGGPDPSCPFQAVLATGQKAEALITRVSPEGLLLYFRVYAYPVSGPSGAMTHVLMMRRDITARTRKEKLRQQADRLAVVGEMSTYLAHEIRNPLFAIAGFTNSLLRMDTVDAKEREKLEIIAAEARRLDRMLTDLLRFARADAVPGGQTDLNRAVTEAVDLLTMSHAHQGFRFLVLAEPGLPRVAGQIEQIKQCLVNVLLNAVEAMPGGGQAVISTGMEGDMVFVRVDDAGPGLAEAQMDQAFSPFFSTKERGYGLGLAMVKKVVEDLGGRADLKSRPGQGASVTLFLRPVLPESRGQGEVGAV